MTNKPQPPNPAPQKIRAWDNLAEQRIQAAQSEGKFDNLPGFGKPIPGLDEPHDDLWWVKDKLKREQLNTLPPALAIRLDQQNTLQKIRDLRTEAAVRQELTALNDRVRKAAFAITWGPSVDVVPLSPAEIDTIIADWKAAARASTASIPN